MTNNIRAHCYALGAKRRRREALEERDAKISNLYLSPSGNLIRNIDIQLADAEKKLKSAANAHTGDNDIADHVWECLVSWYQNRVTTLKRRRTRTINSCMEVTA